METAKLFPEHWYKKLRTDHMNMWATGNYAFYLFKSWLLQWERQITHWNKQWDKTKSEVGARTDAIHYALKLKMMASWRTMQMERLL